LRQKMGENWHPPTTFRHYIISVDDKGLLSNLKVKVAEKKKFVECSICFLHFVSAFSFQWKVRYVYSSLCEQDLLWGSKGTCQKVTCILLCNLSFMKVTIT
jgi:hypothetical protein